MDRGFTRHVLRCVNSCCKIGQQAAPFSNASRVISKGSSRSSPPHRLSFSKKYQRVHNKKQNVSDAQRFRQFTDAINKDLSVPIETLGVWVADFLRLNLNKRLEGSDSSEASYC